MKIGYARTSLTKQDIDRQFDELQAEGVDLRNIYCEKVHGNQRNRPELNRMIEILRDGDVVIFTELTRLGRSTSDLLEIADKIKQRGANFKSLGERWLDTTTPSGQLVFTFFAGIAQFERELTIERTKSGLRAARARGRVGGRPSKQNEKADIVKMLCDRGMGPTAIYHALDRSISISTISRILRKLREEESHEEWALNSQGD